MLRKIITALSALALATVGTVVVAPSANAVTAASYCFQYEKGGYPYARQTVFIQLSDDNVNWMNALEMTTDAYGCGSFYVWGADVNRYARAVAWQEVRTSLGGVAAVWSGTSPYYGLPGEMSVSLGTGVVTCVSRTVYACP